MDFQTPRTNTEEIKAADLVKVKTNPWGKQYIDGGACYVVPSDFARTLEKEITALQSIIEELRRINSASSTTINQLRQENNQLREQHGDKKA